MEQTKRPYRRITKEVVARHLSERAVQGNGTRAVEVLEPGYKSPHVRANSISKNMKELSSDEYVEKRLEQISERAIERVDEVINSTDTPQALKASIFVIEQRRGKAVQRNVNVNANVTIQDVLG
jgi:hypothetical protein